MIEYLKKAVHPFTIFWGLMLTLFGGCLIGATIGILIGFRSELAVGSLALGAGFVSTLLVVWRYRSFDKPVRARILIILQRLWLLIVAVWLLGLLFAISKLAINLLHK
jgi:hypothetical protein